jgi:uncharacterized membrane protein YdcZ (DUF606 family)
MNSLLTPRRVVATVFLAVVVGMIVLGQTALNGRLSPLGTILYWSVCLLLTLATIVLSLIDLLRTVRETRRTQRELVTETMEQIEHDAGGHNTSPESR